MKLPLLSCLVLAIVLATPGWADDLQPLFVRLDADSNGRITMNEVRRDHAELFARLLRNSDRDGDGTLSAQEFMDGLTPTRPEKPLAKKGESELPGSDALLLMLAWMDRDANLTIAANEVPRRLQPLFEQFVDLLTETNKTRIRVPQLRQQSIRYAGMSARFANQLGIDVEVELALLNDSQSEYVRRLKTSLRPGGSMANPDTADPKRVEMLLAKLDTNGDGKVGVEEVPQAFAEQFSRLLERGDRDQDKQLSEAELAAMGRWFAAMESNRPPLTETTQRARQLLRRSDRNGDGRLSREELPPRMAQRFGRLDEDGNGQLEVDELARAVENLAALRNSARIRPDASLPGK